MIAQYGRSAEMLLTLEDHVLAGGFGSAVLEELSRQGLSTPVVRIGWPDQFIEHGKPEELRSRARLALAGGGELPIKSCLLDKHLPIHWTHSQRCCKNDGVVSHG